MGKVLSKCCSIPPPIGRGNAVQGRLARPFGEGVACGFVNVVPFVDLGNVVFGIQDDFDPMLRVEVGVHREEQCRQLNPFPSGNSIKRRAEL